jgi:hypothetical protein
MVVLYKRKVTLIRGKAAIGSFADIMIEIKRMSLKDNTFVIEFKVTRIVEKRTIPKMVENMPKKAMLKKLLKN